MAGEMGTPEAAWPMATPLLRAKEPTPLGGPPPPAPAVVVELLGVAAGGAPALPVLVRSGVLVLTGIVSSEAMLLDMEQSFLGRGLAAHLRTPHA